MVYTVSIQIIYLPDYKGGLTESPTGSVAGIEYPIYGGALLGMYKQTSSLSRADEIDMSAGTVFVRNLNRRFYELTIIWVMYGR